MLTDLPTPPSLCVCVCAISALFARYRVTRNAELGRHEDEAEDLLELIAEEVRERMFAPFVRLEVQAGTPAPLVDLLAEELELNRERDVYVQTLLSTPTPTPTTPSLSFDLRRWFYRKVTKEAGLKEREDLN